MDRLILSTETLTDAQLQELFGYRSTAPTGPLQPPGADPWS